MPAQPGTARAAPGTPAHRGGGVGRSWLPPLALACASARYHGSQRRRELAEARAAAKGIAVPSANPHGTDTSGRSPALSPAGARSLGPCRRLAHR